MNPSVFVAGLDARGLLLEAPLLQREGCAIEEFESARALLAALPHSGACLLVLGSRLPDFGLPETIRWIRSSVEARAISILAVLVVSDGPETEAEAAGAGANAVLRRPLDRQVLEASLAKLLAVPRRVDARVLVEGQLVGTPRLPGASHFCGFTLNLSVHGLLLASPVRLDGHPDLELELKLPERASPFRALGRVVREASNIKWPYLGYGVEFLYVPLPSLEGLMSAVTRGVRDVTAVENGLPPGIHSTLRREAWIYEILEPVHRSDSWFVEIRRAPQDEWRPGVGGPFFVVSGSSPKDALLRAREFLRTHA